ncbi:hypothetical protein I7I48_08006 [Histoplasma ohiense]|nr:hypothetical protein I7I48_08006 [Histoplasma ohiense (nom. inval.)]
MAVLMLLGRKAAVARVLQRTVSDPASEPINPRAGGFAPTPAHHRPTPPKQQVIQSRNCTGCLDLRAG